MTEATTGCATQQRSSSANITENYWFAVHFIAVCIRPHIHISTLLQLKIAYSVHRDLNVKANNDKSWDYGGGGATPGAAAGLGPPTNGYNPSATASLAADEPPTGELRTRPLPPARCKMYPGFGMQPQRRRVSLPGCDFTMDCGAD